MKATKDRHNNTERISSLLERQKTKITVLCSKMHRVIGFMKRNSGDGLYILTLKAQKHTCYEGLLKFNIV